MHCAQNEIPHMFQISHRQNHAEQTQTREGLPVMHGGHAIKDAFPALPLTSVSSFHRQIYCNSFNVLFRRRICAYV